MKRLLGFFLFASFASVVSIVSGQDVALRQLASPDISQFSARLPLGTVALATPDNANNRVYFSGLFSHVNGIPVGGLFRTDSTGNLDLSWLPGGRLSVPGAGGSIPFTAGTKLKLLPGGDVMVSGADRLLRISAADASRITSYLPPAPVAPATSLKLRDFAVLDGWVYLSLEEFAGASASSGSGTGRVHRLSSETGQIDASWSMALPAAPRLEAEATGSLFVTLYRPANGVTSAETSVARMPVDGSGSLSWSLSLGAALVDAIRVDAAGRAYVVYSTANPQSIQVLRLLPNGSRDSAWSTTEASAAFSSSLSGFQGVGLIGDSLVALSSNAPSGATPLSQSLVVFAGDGRVRSSTVLPIDPDNQWRSLGSANGAAVVVESKSFSRVDVTTGSLTATSKPVVVGGAGSNVALRTLASGQTVAVGDFTTWTDGIEQRGFVIFDGNGVPLKGLSTPASVSGSSLRYLGELPSGEVAFLAAPLSPTSTHRVIFADVTSKTIRVVSVTPPTGDGLASVALGADGYIYLLIRGSASSVQMRRAAAGSGALDPNWSLDSRVPAVDGGTRGDTLQADSAGGLWVSVEFVPGIFDSEPRRTMGFLRFSATSPTQLPQAFGRGSTQQGCVTSSLVFSVTHAYVCGERFTMGQLLQRDLTWATVSPPVVVGADFAYYLQSDQTLRRASATGTGAFDSTWSRTLPTGISSISYAVIGGRLTLSGWANSGGSSNPVWALFSDVAGGPTPKRVVEYQVRGQERFFISGRSDEQALLDARADLFVRTGASFLMPDGTFRENGVDPVCRFFAPAVLNGKSSHFFGIAKECQMLNSLSGFAYEGLDFGSVRPLGGACPASHPAPITRLFNNRNATLEGNHRYVGDSPTKSRMMSLGWVDEGVVFCAASAIPANQ